MTWNDEKRSRMKADSAAGEPFITKDHFDNQFDDNYTVKADVPY